MSATAPHPARAAEAPPIPAAGTDANGDPLPNPARSRTIALIVACALFMQNLDSTIVATALPAMARSFGAEPLHMSVALTSYLLSLSMFVPASGWVADRFGARTVFRVAIVLFTFGSVLCGLADSLPFLAGARVVQGLGGAMMLPVGRLVLLRSVAKTDLVAAMAWLTIPSLIGPVIGPPLGGAIATYADWRLIFYINVPIGLIGVVLVTLFIEEVREPPRGRFDLVGLGLSASALACLLFGFETIGRGIVPSAVTLAAICAGAAAGVGYVVHARRVAAPLLDLTLFRVPTFVTAVWAGTLFRIGIGAIPFLLPLMLQLGFGLSPAQSGLITFISSAGALVMKTVAPRALRLIGFRTTLVWNGLISAVLLAACALFRPSWPVVLIYGVLLVGGFFRSLQFTAFNTLAYADIPRPRMSAATSLYATMQQLSMTLGITIGASSLGASMTLLGHPQPALTDFSIAFLLIAGIAVLSTPFVARLPADAGAEISGQKRVG